MKRRPTILSKEQYALLWHACGGIPLVKEKWCRLCWRRLGKDWRWHLRSHWDAAEPEIRSTATMVALRKMQASMVEQWAAAMPEIFGFNPRSRESAKWWLAHPPMPPGVRHG